MPYRGNHCPFLNRTDERCAEHFSLDELEYAFNHCFGQYRACAAYQELLAERQTRRALAYAAQGAAVAAGAGDPDQGPDDHSDFRGGDGRFGGAGRRDARDGRFAVLAPDVRARQEHPHDGTPTGPQTSDLARGDDRRGAFAVAPFTPLTIGASSLRNGARERRDTQPRAGGPGSAPAGAIAAVVAALPSLPSLPALPGRLLQGPAGPAGVPAAPGI